MPNCLAASYKVLMFAWPRELWKSLTSMLDGAPGRIVAATIAGDEGWDRRVGRGLLE